MAESSSLSLVVMEASSLSLVVEASSQSLRPGEEAFASTARSASRVDEQISPTTWFSRKSRRSRSARARSSPFSKKNSKLMKSVKSRKRNVNQLTWESSSSLEISI